MQDLVSVSFFSVYEIVEMWSTNPQFTLPVGLSLDDKY